jgi:hypothetical protein
VVVRGSRSRSLSQRLAHPRYARKCVAHESFNPKRSLQEGATLSPAQVEDWVEAARSGGNPEHKRNPGDFGLTPPADARMGKTLCDSVGIFSRNAALDLLREGPPMRVGEPSATGWLAAKRLDDLARW